MSRSIPTPERLPSGNWRVRITVGGKQYSITDRYKETALARALAMRDGREKEKTVPRKSLGAVVDEYIELRSNVLSPATIRSYNTSRKYRFRDYMDLPLADLDRQTLQRMVNEEAQRVSAKSVRNAWGLVTAALAEYNINYKGINLPPIPRHERPYLTHTEILTFCRAVTGERCEIPALLALCSLRLSEIAALDWKDVNTRKNTITVRGAVVRGPYGYEEKQTNKTASSSRTVPIIIPQLRKLLAKKGTGKVFTGTPNSVYTDVNKVCRRAGLPEVGVHGLRHSFASLCHHLGIPELECAKMGGWKDLGTMRKIYTHLSEQDMTDAGARLQAFFCDKE